METFSRNHTRRQFLLGLGTAAAALWSPEAFAEERARWVETGDYLDDLVVTPKMTEGPFFPDRLPLDTDNDLLVINSSLTPADGEVTHLSGRILNLRGEPIRNATIEIWQVDCHGAYIHSGSDNRDKLDKNFQGFGRYLTDSTGEYRFRTVKPVPYPGRPPHIHVKVKHGANELLTTQCFVKGDPGNDRDGILRSIRDPKARESVLVPFAPLAGSKVGELTARFDIVVGFTPRDEH